MLQNYFVSGAIFLITFIAILRDRVDRTILAMAGAGAMLVAGLLLGFYSEEAALDAVDFATLGLLLGMMVLVALGISPVPFLISEALLSNTGGVATLVGDPPNILIGSAANFSFNDFLVRLAPIVLVAWVAAVFTLRFLFRKELSKRPKNVAALAHLDEKEAIHDRKRLIRVLVVMAIVILFFFLHTVLYLAPAVVALLGAAVAFLWVQPDVDHTLKEIEWSTLLFFAALFVLVGGINASGLLNELANALTGLTQTNLLLSGLALIWGAAILSAVVDNIPFTIVMIPVIQSLGAQGVDITPLWWALALGAGFGGNATPIGSTANVIAVKLSERTRSPISTQRWLRTGLPVMFVTCLVATVLYALTFSFM